MATPEKKRYMPIPYSELENLGNASPIPKSLQELKILEYDTDKFPFRKAVADILDVREDELSTLHETEQGSKAFRQEQNGSQQRKRGKQPHFVKVWTRAGQTGKTKIFNQILESFVREVVSVNMQVTGEPAKVAYQKEPTFRVVLPSGEQLGYRHCDADYHHPPAEINWWIPLTPVQNSNSLFTESLPGKGDFVPMEMQYGQALRFYGNLCCHYTVPNTSDSCRVSFDMRVLSLDHHRLDWTDRLARPCIFKLGAYYNEILQYNEISK